MAHRMVRAGTVPLEGAYGSTPTPTHGSTTLMMPHTPSMDRQKSLRRTSTGSFCPDGRSQSKPVFAQEVRSMSKASFSSDLRTPSKAGSSSIFVSQSVVVSTPVARPSLFLGSVSPRGRAATMMPTPTSIVASPAPRGSLVVTSLTGTEQPAPRAWGTAARPSMITPCPVQTQVITSSPSQRPSVSAVSPGGFSSGSDRPKPPDLNVTNEDGDGVDDDEESVAEDEESDPNTPLAIKKMNSTSWRNYPTTPIFKVTMKALGTAPRFGIDIGGVITREGDPTMSKEDEWSTDWAADGALDAVRRIVSCFGAENTFIVSKVRPGGAMHRKCEQWLHETIDFCAVTGFKKENIVFVAKVGGPDGKGPAASQLGLSHFVDDKLEALTSVYADEAGNSGHCIEKYQGLLYHFPKGGWGGQPECDMSEVAPRMRRYYKGVANWAELLEVLRERLPPILKERADELTKPLPPIGVSQPKAESSSERAARELPPWVRAQREASPPRAVSPMPAAQPVAQPVAQPALIGSRSPSGRPKLMLKPRSEQGAPEPSAMPVAAPVVVSIVPAGTAAAPVAVTSPTAQRANSRQPALQPNPGGRPKLVLKPRDPKLGQAVQAVVAAPPPEPAGPALQRDPEGGRPRLVLKKRTEAPVAAPVATSVRAVSPTAPRSPTASATTIKRPSVVLASTSSAVVVSASPRNRSPSIGPSNTVAAPVFFAAPAPPPQASAALACTAPSNSSAPALQKDPVTGRPRLMLKPRTVPVAAS